MAREEAGADTSDSGMTAVTAGNGAKGSYVELISSTARATERINVFLAYPSATKQPLTVYIAVGAAASEVDVLAFTAWVGTGAPDVLEFPVSIGSGQRVSAAMASDSSVPATDISISLGDESGYGTSNSYELTDLTSGNQGIDVDPGGTANTKGAYSELIASTSIDYDYFVLCLGLSNNNNMTNGRFLIDIATGAASSEVVLIENIPYSQDSSENGSPPFIPFWEPIPSGTRIAVRAQCDITDAADRIFDAAITGQSVTAPSGGGGESSHVFAC